MAQRKRNLVFKTSAVQYQTLETIAFNLKTLTIGDPRLARNKTGLSLLCVNTSSSD